jgi:hypothetical protein
MIPGTGSPGLDAVLQIGIVLGMITSLVLLIRNRRDR